MRRRLSCAHGRWGSLFDLLWTQVARAAIDGMGVQADSAPLKYHLLIVVPLGWLAGVVMMPTCKHGAGRCVNSSWMLLTECDHPPLVREVPSLTWILIVVTGLNSEEICQGSHQDLLLCVFLAISLIKAISLFFLAEPMKDPYMLCC